MAWEIRKKGYSRNPWRLVTGAGQEVSTVCSVTGIEQPVSGETKAEVERWALERLEWYAAHARNGLLPSIYSQNWRTTATLDTTATVADGGR